MSQYSELHKHNNELEIVEFMIDEETYDGSIYSGSYGINVAKVIEIIRMPVVTEMPGEHDSAVLGTFNFRGKVLPILNLGTWFGKKTIATPNDKVLVTEFSGVQAAFQVSSVAAIHRLTWDAIEPPNRYMQQFSRESITGILRIEQRVLFIPDMEKILATLDSTLDMSKAELDTTHVDKAEEFHLLVADDSKPLRHIIKSALEKSGFKVTVAASGLEAWQWLKEQHQEAQRTGQDITDMVQLVISDIEMPEMDGHALTLKIREDPALQILPVILFSSLITDALRDKGIKVGADRQVSKPDLPGLNSLIRDLIAEKLHR